MINVAVVSLRVRLLGLQNTGNFCQWYLESGILLVIRIRNPSFTDKESTACHLKSKQYILSTNFISFIVVKPEFVFLGGVGGGEWRGSLELAYGGRRVIPTLLMELSTFPFRLRLYN